MDSRGFAGFDKGEETVRKGGRAHSPLRREANKVELGNLTMREYEDEVELDQMGPVKRLKSRRIV